MKIKGKEIKSSNIEFVVLPRNDGDIVFECHAVLDYKPFDLMCPEPKPPFKMLPGGQKLINVEDAKYKEKLSAINLRKISWMVLKSLEPTGIEWDTVKMDDPETWGNYIADFQKAGFSEVEINRIVMGVMAACSLDEAKIEEARQRFLTSRRDTAENSSIQMDAQQNTPSGESANVSA